MKNHWYHRLDGHRAAKIVYGIIIVLVVIITLEDHPPAPLNATLSILGAAFAVALAEFYSDMVGQRIHKRDHLSWTERREVATSVGAVVIGALIPLPFFLIAGLGLITSLQAFLFAKWALIALLAAYGYAAAALSGSSRFWAIFYALLAGAIGTAVVLAKYYLSGH